ncbi:MAG: hypothetical protein KAS72_04395 [Phycisphaerales bacterium]|nr:hypothetical protein [Phycisphaerales bacterium]
MFDAPLRCWRESHDFTDVGDPRREIQPDRSGTPQAGRLDALRHMLTRASSVQFPSPLDQAADILASGMRPDRLNIVKRHRPEGLTDAGLPRG